MAMDGSSITPDPPETDASKLQRAANLATVIKTSLENASHHRMTEADRIIYYLASEIARACSTPLPDAPEQHAEEMLLRAKQIARDAVKELEDVKYYEAEVRRRAIEILKRIEAIQ